MTTFFDNEIDRIFKRMSNPFFHMDDIFGDLPADEAKSYSFGYTMTVGPDGRVVVRKLGDAATDKPDLPPNFDVREPIVDTIVDEKEEAVKLIAEMPGVEKTDVKILVDENKMVDISAERDTKKYHIRVPLKHKVVEDSAKASYKNGILQLVFKLVDNKPTGKKVEVQ